MVVWTDVGATADSVVGSVGEGRGLSLGPATIGPSNGGGGFIVCSLATDVMDEVPALLPAVTSVAVFMADGEVANVAEVVNEVLCDATFCAVHVVVPGSVIGDPVNGAAAEELSGALRVCSHGRGMGGPG